MFIGHLDNLTSTTLDLMIWWTTRSCIVWRVSSYSCVCLKKAVLIYVRLKMSVKRLDLAGLINLVIIQNILISVVHNRSVRYDGTIRCLLLQLLKGVHGVPWHEEVRGGTTGDSAGHWKQVRILSAVWPRQHWLHTSLRRKVSNNLLLCEPICIRYLVS